MSIIEKWDWIKRNWTYILEEASDLNLVFVGGTALNLALFKEYRASEDIDLYDPYSDTIGTLHEEESLANLAQNLARRGFTIQSRNKRAIFVGPNIKVEVFNDGTPFTKIQKKTFEQTIVHLFDMKTYAEMKITALLCRSEYDARDLVDVFVIQKETGLTLSFPKRDCDVILNRFPERLENIKNTIKEDLFVFQTVKQVDDLPFDEFEKFRGWIYEWLSRFC